MHRAQEAIAKSSAAPRDEHFLPLTPAESRRGVMEAACKASSRAHFTQGGVTIGATLEGAPESPRVVDGCDLLVEGDVTARLSLFDVEFMLRGVLVRDGERLMLAPSFELFALDRRSNARLPLPRGTASLRFSSMDEATVRTAEVADLSLRGVKIVVDRSQASTLPRGKFPAMLEMDGRRVFCLGEARHRETREGKEELGVELRVGGDTAPLLDAYLGVRFPRLALRREVNRNDVRGLMEESGYLALRDESDPTSEWLDANVPEALSRDVVYRTKDGRCLGHVSSVRAYSNTWLSHQLATLSGDEETAECRLSLYQHMCSLPRLVDGEDAKMVAYFSREKRWHKLFFDNFVDWAGSPERVLIYPLDRFERDASLPPVVVAPQPGIDVREANDFDLLAATTLVRKHLPPLVAEAFDVRPETLTAEHLHPGYAGTDIPRGRQTLVLFSGNELLGVALCETGSRSLSLFNILNMAHIYFRNGVPASVQAHLVARVRSFYAERGISSPLVVSPAGNLNPAAEPGTARAETMGCIVFSAEGLQLWQNYLQFTFAFRWNAFVSGAIDLTSSKQPNQAA